jgi:hypothetical protein
MTRVCCVCNRVERENGWQGYHVAGTGEFVTHGYCPRCFLEAMAEVNLYLAQGNGTGLQVAGKAGREQRRCD